MSEDHATSDPSTWDPALDAVTAAPKNHKVVFEHDQLRVLEMTLETGEEEALHHHRWPAVFVFDQMQGPVYDIAPDGTTLPPYLVDITALAKLYTKSRLDAVLILFELSELFVLE